MQNSPLPEVWLRGPVPGVSPLLQPVAHALLQAKEEVGNLLQEFPDHLLWEKPGGLASAGFHLQHLSGVLDRLFTYADGNALSTAQLDALRKEGTPIESAFAKSELLAAFQQQVECSIKRLQNWKEDSLHEERKVGRAQLPSTVLGLLFHAAEHTMRHTGQLLVTVKWLNEKL